MAPQNEKSEKVKLVIECDESHANRLKKFFDELPSTEERILSNLETTQTLSEEARTLQDQIVSRSHEIEQLQQSIQVRQKALQDMMKEPESKGWDWKRATLASVMTLAGFGLSWFLRKKAPIVNYAASGVTGALLFNEVSPLRDHKAIGGAITSLSARWAHDNDNLACTLLEVGLPTVAFGKAFFDMTECAVDGIKEGWRSASAAIKETFQKEDPAPKKEGEKETGAHE